MELSIVSFNITRHSSTFRAIQLSGLFNVHLLTSDVQHKQHHGTNEGIHRSYPELIAHKFSMGNKGRPFHQETGEVEDWIDLSAMIRGHTDEGAVIVPFHLLCEHMTEKTVWIGDHVVVFGRVMSVVDNLKNDNGLHDGSRKTTLAYVHGRYARVV
ncbi:hypothetical protein DV737_g4087, partial [Chaetothyriales sp. CBS 132003]